MITESMAKKLLTLASMFSMTEDVVVTSSGVGPILLESWSQPPPHTPTIFFLITPDSSSGGMKRARLTRRNLEGTSVLVISQFALVSLHQAALEIVQNEESQTSDTKRRVSEGAPAIVLVSQLEMLSPTFDEEVTRVKKEEGGNRGSGNLLLQEGGCRCCE
uniref:Uncharacterized protein n=1 Tax=Pristionchus pacificus TaxID=54126 RepID=A0A2A6CUB8_PRIPA|eukprot:PDM81812.1 hypothetical protein PRIPAC_33966 [Pristionchus pacificus]